MTKRSQVWHVRRSTEARADLREILTWTQRRFGPTQSKIYRATIQDALDALRAGPSALGVRPRDDIAPGLMTLPVARGGRKGRHLIVFRIAPGENHPTLDVLRVLHESMDLPRHLTDDETA